MLIKMHTINMGQPLFSCFPKTLINDGTWHFAIQLFQISKAFDFLISWKKNLNSNEAQCDQKCGTKWTIMYWNKLRN